MFLFSSDIIDHLGGTAGLSAACGVLKSTVSNWRVMGFPPRRAQQIASVAEKQKAVGITVETVLRAKPGRSPGNPLKEKADGPPRSKLMNASGAAQSSRRATNGTQGVTEKRRETGKTKPGRRDDSERAVG